MASDHLIKETNKFLERIAKAAERTATALEKMVVEDDEEPIKESQEPADSDLWPEDGDPSKLSDQVKAFDPGLELTGWERVKISGRRLIEVVCADENTYLECTDNNRKVVYMLAVKTGANEVVFRFEKHRRHFEMFKGWVE